MKEVVLLSNVFKNVDCESSGAKVIFKTNISRYLDNTSMTFAFKGMWYNYI